MPKDDYRKEVIDPGDRASQYARDICQASQENCPAIIISNPGSRGFRGSPGILPQKHILEMMLEGKMEFVPQNDGAGGKLGFHAAIGSREFFFRAPWEIICMTADDIARDGDLPCYLSNDINAKMVSEQNWPLVQSTLDGLGEALKLINLANPTGEFAIMKFNVTCFCDTGNPLQLIMNWSAHCEGLRHMDRQIDTNQITPGMPIIGFWETGYRCNGGTKLIKLAKMVWGEDTVKMLNNPEAITFLEKCAVPSQSYARTLADIHGWEPDGNLKQPRAVIKGIAHITGGGVMEKLGEILPQGVGAHLDKMEKPPQILLEAQELSWNTTEHLPDSQAYSTFHGGPGMILIAQDKENSQSLIGRAKSWGIKAYEIGVTTESKKGEILIQSRFKEGKELSSLK